MEERSYRRRGQNQGTLEDIRTAVDKLVGEMGFEAMRIQDICREARVSTGAFYHYFASKDDLLIDRYIRANTAQRQLYTGELTALHPIDAIARFFEVMEAYTRTRQMGVLVQYIKVQAESFARWEKIDGNATRDILEALVSDGIERGKIVRRYPVTQVVDYLMEYYHGFNFVYTITGGTHLEGKSTLPILRDWLESLRIG